MWHASSAGPLQLKEVMLFAWRGPRGSTQLFASPSGSDVVAQVHAGPRRSEREGVESRGSSVGRAWLFYIASFVCDTALCMAWVHAGPAQVLCGFKRQIYCLRGGEAMRGAGPCGPCAGPAGPTHVARGPRGA